MDTAGELLVVDRREDAWATVRRVPLGEAGHMRVVRLLGTLGLDVLVCGAVSRRFAAMLADLDMTVMPWVTGDLESVLAALTEGTLGEDRYRMPGCRHDGRGAGRGRGRRRGGGR